MYFAVALKRDGNDLTLVIPVGRDLFLMRMLPVIGLTQSDVYVGDQKYFLHVSYRIESYQRSFVAKVAVTPFKKPIPATNTGFSRPTHSQQGRLNIIVNAHDSHVLVRPLLGARIVDAGPPVLHSTMAWRACQLTGRTGAVVGFQVGSFLPISIVASTVTGAAIGCATGAAMNSMIPVFAWAPETRFHPVVP